MVQSHLNESFGSYHSTNSKQFQLSNESGNSACMNGIHPTYFQDSDIYGLFRKPRKETEKIAMVFLPFSFANCQAEDAQPQHHHRGLRRAVGHGRFELCRLEKGLGGWLPM